MPIIGGGSASAGGPSSPGFEIGYDQITSSVNIVGTTEASPTTIITCAAHVFDGAAVVCQFYASQIVFDTAVANDTLGISLWEGASELGILAFMRAGTTGGVMTAGTYQVRFTPTAASHAYLIRAWATSTTGTPQIAAGAGGVGTNFPSFARFTKV